MKPTERPLRGARDHFDAFGRAITALRATALAPLLTLGCALLVSLGAAPAAHAKNIALLMGVSDYGNPRSNLEGPVNDVNSMRDVLIERWGFARADVQTLIDAQASKPGILQALRDLMTRSKPGDEVFIYFSGHGTSALNSDFSDVPVPHGTGAMIPYGLDTRSPQSIAAGLIIGRTDLRPHLTALEKGGRHVWLVSDSCYSGQLTRSVVLPSPDRLPERTMVLPAAEMARDQAMVSSRPAGLEPYPYSAVAFLSAAAEGERAKDIPRSMLGKLPTVDGKAHGAMTDALLRVLKGELPADTNRDGVLDLNEVQRAVADYLAQRAMGHTPQRLPSVAEDSKGLGTRAVLAATRVAAAPVPEPDAASGRRIPTDEALAVAFVATVPTPALRVRADGMPSALAQSLKALRGVDWLDAPGPADVVLFGAQGRLVLASGAGDKVADFAAGEVSLLQAQLQQMAWANRLRHLGQKNSRGTLAFEIDPSTFGGNMALGCTLRFVARPDRAANLVVVNVQSDAKVSVLYPFAADELRKLPAGAAQAIPDNAKPPIKAQLPLGMDMQFAFAFDEPPASLPALLNVVDVSVNDGRLKQLEAMLVGMKGRFTMASSELRVLPAGAKCS